MKSKKKKKDKKCDLLVLTGQTLKRQEGKYITGIKGLKNG